MTIHELRGRNVQELKALWRAHDRLSCCSALAGKLAALDACKAGASPIEGLYVQQGYSLPAGWTWTRTAEHRAVYKTPASMVPLASAGGVVAWGVPIVNGRFLLHPGNLEQVER